MSEAQPSFKGSVEDQSVAEAMWGLMLMQARSYAADAPIRQSLHNFAEYFLEKGLRQTIEEAAAVVESAALANGHVFFRNAAGDDVSYVTSRAGKAMRPAASTPTRYLPPAASRAPAPAPAPRRQGAPVVITRATILTGGVAMAPSLRPVIEEATILRGTLRPTLIRREEQALAETVSAPDLELELEREDEEQSEETIAAVQAEAAREVKPEPPAYRPQVITPEGLTIYLDEGPEKILAKHGASIKAMVSEALASDQRFVAFGDEWFLADLVVPFGKAELRRIHEAIEETADVLPDSTFLTDLLGKNPDDEDYERSRFSLNLAMSREKRIFEFRGTAQERYWGVVAMASPRPARSTLRPSEIGQDFKFLEDETPRSDEGAGRWVHSLTFYEIENGLLPYSATAKLIFPRAVLKEQRAAHLEFHAPQLNLSVPAELHYPSGNRGGWIDGLEDVLDRFVPGARIVVEGAERDNQFLISFRKGESRELESVVYDEKKRRFGFAAMPVEYQVDEAMLVTKSRYKNLANALRLDEAIRRKGDQVISFAFIKVGTKLTEDDKTYYRTSISDLLPVVNLEKPFSVASLVRFMTTHPHYQKDETQDGFYFYKPEE